VVFLYQSKSLDYPNPLKQLELLKVFIRTSQTRVIPFGVLRCFLLFFYHLESLDSKIHPISRVCCLTANILRAIFLWFHLIVCSLGLQAFTLNLSFSSDPDRDQVTNNQVNVPTVQPSQDKGSKAQELAQVIKDIMAAQTTQNPAQQPGFVSLITQA